MTSKSDNAAELAHNAEIGKELAQRGITCVPIDNYYYREFHYTNLDDAVAQMTRDRKRIGLPPAV